MKRKLVTYFPIAVLAVGLTLGMAAALIALRPSGSVPTVSAQTPGTVSASPTTAGELVEYAITVSVTGVMPAGTGEFRITFDKDAQIPATIPASSILIQSSLLQGTAEFGTASCDDADGLNSNDGANQVIALTQSPSFDVDTADPNRKILILKVPDMNPSTGTGSCGAGAQGIGGAPTNATVVITFTSASGIKNPSEIETSTFNLLACASACTSSATNLIITPASPFAVTVGIVGKLTLNAVDGARGTRLTVVAKGLKDGTTATFWLDRDTLDLNCDGDTVDFFTGALTELDVNTVGAGVDLNGNGTCTETGLTLSEVTVGHDLNCDGDAVDTSVTGLSETTFVFDLNGDGDCADTAVTNTRENGLPGDNIRESGETDLADVVVGSDDTATATFTVNNPPFFPGKINSIAVQDGRVNKAPNPTSTGLPKFELRGSVEATPTTVRLGDTLTIQLKDFDVGCNIVTAAGCLGTPSIQLGGVTLDSSKFSGTTVIATNGEATFTALVPNGVAIGTQALEVRNVCCAGTNSTRRQNLTVGGATLILTPQTVAPNQTLSITGNDYTTSDIAAGVTINAASVVSPCTVLGGMSIQGVGIARSKINDGNNINVAAGGNWSSSVLIPVNTTTTTPGTYDLKVTDCQGREGVSKLTIPARVVNLNPKEGQVGTSVTITGTGFPSKNDRSGSVSTTVSIKYDAGAAGGVTTISVQPDASGNINGTLTVPTNSNIPSSNNVTVSFRTEGATVDDVINTVVHEVPRASITITPATGKPGTKVTAAIRGAKAFSTISSALIGASLDVRPAPTPFTDGVGNVTFDFIVPQMEVGVQNLEVKIGNTTASAAFTVEGAATVPPPGTVPPTTPIGTALTTPLGVDFVRAFNFNNQTKVWTFNDPRPEFAAINTLKDINGGQVYWINVANDKTITFCGRSVTFYKGWNQSPC